MFLNRLLHNTIERPRGEIVKAAFEAWNVPLPAPLMKELRGRGRSAHRFIMFDETAGRVQEASERVEMVQTMLATAIALSVGYQGAIVGWERDQTGHLRPPEFWREGDEPEARKQYMIGVTHDDESSGSD